jgi:hypothetical protein
MQSVIAQRPAVTEELARVLAGRQVNLQTAKEGLSADAARERANRETNALLSRIRSFFAID